MAFRVYVLSVPRWGLILLKKTPYETFFSTSGVGASSRLWFRRMRDWSDIHIIAVGPVFEIRPRGRRFLFSRRTDAKWRPTKRKRIDLHDDDMRTTTTMAIRNMVDRWCLDTQSMSDETFPFFLPFWQNAGIESEKRTRRMQKDNPAHSFNPVSGVAKSWSFAQKLTHRHTCMRAHTHTTPTTRQTIRQLCLL